MDRGAARVTARRFRFVRRLPCGTLRTPPFPAPIPAAAPHRTALTDASVPSPQRHTRTSYESCTSRRTTTVCSPYALHAKLIAGGTLPSHFRSSAPRAADPIRPANFERAGRHTCIALHSKTLAHAAPSAVPTRHVSKGVHAAHRARLLFHRRSLPRSPPPSFDPPRPVPCSPASSPCVICPRSFAMRFAPHCRGVSSLQPPLVPLPARLPLPPRSCATPIPSIRGTSCRRWQHCPRIDDFARPPLSYRWRSP